MRNRAVLAAAGVLGVSVIMGASATVQAQAPSETPAALVCIHKIRHVIVIFQENRSFDSYFGTYPGADGIPALLVQKPVQPAVEIRCVQTDFTKCCDKFFRTHVAFLDSSKIQTSFIPVYLESGRIVTAKISFGMQRRVSSR